MTWQQLAGWRKAHEQRPWGEVRADLRALANTLWLLRTGEADLPNLTWPYIETSDVIEGKIAAIEATKEERFKAAEEKLREARRKHRGG